MIEKREIRLIGIGIVASAFVAMIYEVVQIALKLPFDDLMSRNSDMMIIAMKMGAIVPAIFIGLGLLVYFGKVGNR